VDTEDVRLAVYRSFAVTGRPPERGSLDERALRELHDRRHVVLDGDDRIVMAHPFSAVPLGFSVMGRETLWWGGCAWDSFALAHLLLDEPDVLVATRCPGCDAALAWVVGRGAPPIGGEVAHFLIPAARMWDDVMHTCGNQRLFCGQECVAAWLERSGHERGYVMDLATLWRLARGWYEGRLERGYQRREPSEARDYFRSVGLSGRFWGL
jgi:alkylmercury lyase-like protein